MMKLLNEYMAKKKAVHEYFGYESDWVEIPLEDYTEHYWFINGEGRDGEVVFADSKEQLPLTEEAEAAGNYYSHEIYTQRFLSKWVYRGKDFTMISMDTRTDGNKFMGVFDNSKEGQE